MAISGYLYFFVALLAAGGCNAGHWTVGDCLMAEFQMHFLVHPNATGFNLTHTFEVSLDAKALDTSSDCNADSDRQRLSIYWQDRALNDSSILLDRNFTISFAKVSNESYYGVSRVYGFFTLAQWSVDNLTLHSTIELDSGDLTRLMFPTPLSRSFLCADLGNIEIPSRLKYPNSPPSGKALANSTIITTDVRFDAFRRQDVDPPGYRDPLDCNYEPSDAVPIAVGIALAILVVAVLVAYLVGRRRFSRAGYENV